MPDLADQRDRSTGIRVSRALSCGDDRIILLDYYQAFQSKVWTNLRRVNSNGEVVWVASATGAGDIFTDVDWRGGRLVASTWQGYMITVDEQTGKPVETAFTK